LTGLFSRKKADPAEKEKMVKMVIEETDRQIAELRGKLAGVPNERHREQVLRYIERLEDKKRKLQDDTFYK
jgi:phage shock protein A